MPKPGEDEQGHQKNASGSAVIIMIAEIVIMLILVAIIIIVVVAVVVVVVVIVVVVVAVVVTVTIILILRRRIVRHNIHLRSARTCMCLRIRSPLHACPACLSVCVCHGIYVLCLPVCPISVQSLLALPLSPSRSLALSLSLYLSFSFYCSSVPLSIDVSSSGTLSLTVCRILQLRIASTYCTRLYIQQLASW